MYGQLEQDFQIRKHDLLGNFKHRQLDKWARVSFRVTHPHQ